MNNAVIFSSASDEWTTPQNLFDQLNAEFDFEIDLAATAENTKCASFYSLQLDSLSQHWGSRFARGWLNPPYSRGLCGHFIEKAARQRRMGFLTVMLLPSRTDTKAFHAHIYDIDTWQPRNGIEIRLLAGRLRFSNSKTPAPFPSMIVIFRPDTQ
jgi:site-specific DNA-methyltransferase (adenine-specific)